MKYNIGDEVGEYIVTGYIGAGAAGQVFLVEHKVTRRVEAMKVLAGDSASNHLRAERFLREAKVQAKLDHPNITAIHNAFWVDTDLILIMEYVDGESLRQIIERGQAPYVTALSYARQILRALGHAHQRGVVHRDISPSNILVTREGRIKLTDFGLAKEPHDLGLTISGSMLGSLHYSSPEQIRSSAAADARSDLYSCGAVFYELFTLRKVFEAASAFDLMLAHWEKEPTPPMTVNPHLPEFINCAILRALEKDPARRFASAAEFLQLLKEEAPAPEQRVRQVPPMVYAAAAFLGIALTLAGVAFMARDTTAKPVAAAPGPSTKPGPASSPLPAAPTSDPALLQTQPAPELESQIELEALKTPRAEPPPPRVSPAKPQISASKPSLPAASTPKASPVKTPSTPEVARKGPAPGRPAEESETANSSSADPTVETQADRPALSAKGETKEPGVEASRRPGILRSIGNRINIFRKKQQESKQQQ
jgi:serine/threonine-protein kinase